MPAVGRVLGDCDGISPLESVTTIMQDSQLVPIPGARSSRSVGRRSDFVTCLSNHGLLGHMLDHEPSPSLQPLLRTYLLYFTVIESWLSPENVTFPESVDGGCRPSPSQPWASPPARALAGCPEAQAKHTTPPAAPQALGLHNNHTVCLWNQRRGSGCPSRASRTLGGHWDKKFPDLWYPELELGDNHAEAGPMRLARW